jgi:hypothetical protein
MASVFDEASPALRLELVELVRAYVAATPERREVALRVLEPNV